MVYPERIAFKMQPKSSGAIARLQRYSRSFTSCLPQNAIEKGLPTNVDAERFVLGSILLDDSLYIQAAGTLEADDFSLQKHRLIFRRMGELQDAASASTGSPSPTS